MKNSINHCNNMHIILPFLHKQRINIRFFQLNSSCCSPRNTLVPRCGTLRCSPTNLQLLGEEAVINRNEGYFQAISSLEQLIIHISNSKIYKENQPIYSSSSSNQTQKESFISRRISSLISLIQIHGHFYPSSI